MFSYHNSFESKLPEIFKDLHDAYEKIEGRLKAEQFKVSCKLLFYPNLQKSSLLFDPSEVEIM